MASENDEGFGWRRLLLRFGTVGVLASILWLVSGVEALVLIPIVAGIWIVAPTMYAFASGQLLVAVLVAPVVESPLVAVSFGVLFVASFVSDWPFSTAVSGTVVFGLAWVGLGSARLVDPLWMGAVVMLFAFGLLAYGLHRFELVSLGLVQQDGDVR